ncbi:MAG: CbiX/SirB N-terminal domain-containing protein [Acidobacteriota bacterium]
MRTGIVVFGHGSSVASANDAVRSVAGDAARAGRWDLYETAFLEASPRLEDAVANLVAAGADEILVLPYFLTLGIHLQRDLPKIVAELENLHRRPIRVTPPLDGHPALSGILVARASEGMS